MVLHINFSAVIFLKKHFACEEVVLVVRSSGTIDLSAGPVEAPRAYLKARRQRAYSQLGSWTEVGKSPICSLTWSSPRNCLVQIVASGVHAVSWDLSQGWRLRRLSTREF